MRIISIYFCLCLFAIALCVGRAEGQNESGSKVPATAPPAIKKGLTKHWCIVVQNMTYPKRSDIVSETGENRWVEEDEYRTKWKTIVSDGNKTQIGNDLIAVTQDHPYYLKIKTLSKRRYMKGHKRFISYEADEMIMQSLVGTKQTVLAGKAELAEKKKDFAYACREPWDDAFIIPFQSLINPLGFTADTISYENRQNAPGGNHPLHDADWATVRLNNGLAQKLRAAPINAVQLESAKRKWSSEESHEEYSEHWDSFVLLPFNKGFEVFWAFPASEASGRGNLYVLDVQPPSTKYANRKKATNNGAANNRPTNNSVSPDGTCRVSCKSGKLYWQSPLTARAKLIGAVANLRGWEWLDLNKLNDDERQALGL